MSDMFDFSKEMETIQLQEQETERRATGETKRQKRTQLCVSITESDKRKIQQYALDHGVTAASVIHYLIEQYL